MGYDPWDDPVKMMRDMDHIRRMVDPYSDAVHQIQRDYEQMKQFDILGDMKRQLGYGSALQQLEREMKRELGVRRDMLDIKRQLSATVDILGEAAGLGDILLKHRGLIDGYVFGTFYGGSASSLGASTGSKSFQRTNEELAESYEEVSDSLESEEGESVPPTTRSMAAVEAFTSAEVVEELATPPNEKTEDEPEEKTAERETRRQLGQELQEDGRQQLRPALEALEPRLVSLWEGGPLALSSANPDRIRHFCASRRELTTHVLHLLAPDEKIREWNTDENLYHDGRPTRMARLQYICRSIYQNSFRGFVTIDFKLMLETLDFFQKGTHALETDFTFEQLNALNTRADQHLLFLLLLCSNQKN